MSQKKFPWPNYTFIAYLEIIPVYIVICSYIIIRYFGKFLPTRLFHPIFLLFFGQNSILHSYSALHYYSAGQSTFKTNCFPMKKFVKRHADKNWRNSQNKSIKYACLVSYILHFIILGYSTLYTYMQKGLISCISGDDLKIDVHYQENWSITTLFQLEESEELARSSAIHVSKGCGHHFI